MANTTSKQITKKICLLCQQEVGTDGEFYKTYRTKGRTEYYHLRCLA